MEGNVQVHPEGDMAGGAEGAGPVQEITSLRKTPLTQKGGLRISLLSSPVLLPPSAVAHSQTHERPADTGVRGRSAEQGLTDSKYTHQHFFTALLKMLRCQCDSRCFLSALGGFQLGS